jgi:hypothetical protein
VLELGCGHGLPGILCLLAGATVHFQVRTHHSQGGTRSAFRVVCLFVLRACMTLWRNIAHQAEGASLVLVCFLPCLRTYWPPLTHSYTTQLLL